MSWHLFRFCGIGNADHLTASFSTADDGPHDRRPETLHSGCDVRPVRINADPFFGAHLRGHEVLRVLRLEEKGLNEWPRRRLVFGVARTKGKTLSAAGQDSTARSDVKPEHAEDGPIALL